MIKCKEFRSPAIHYRWRDKRSAKERQEFQEMTCKFIESLGRDAVISVTDQFVWQGPHNPYVRVVVYYEDEE